MMVLIIAYFYHFSPGKSKMVEIPVRFAPASPVLCSLVFPPSFARLKVEVRSEAWNLRNRAT